MKFNIVVMAYSNNEKHSEIPCNKNYAMNILRDNNTVILKQYECAETIRMKAVQQIIDDSFKVMNENAVNMKCQFFLNINNKCLLDQIKEEWTNRKITFQIEKKHILIGDKECIKINPSWFK